MQIHDAAVKALPINSYQVSDLLCKFRNYLLTFELTFPTVNGKELESSLLASEIEPGTFRAYDSSLLYG